MCSSCPVTSRLMLDRSQHRFTRNSRVFWTSKNVACHRKRPGQCYRGWSGLCGGLPGVYSRWIGGSHRCSRWLWITLRGYPLVRKRDIPLPIFVSCQGPRREKTVRFENCWRKEGFPWDFLTPDHFRGYSTAEHALLRESSSTHPSTLCYKDPCSKCSQIGHSKPYCNNAVRCGKWKGTHSTTKCKADTQRASIANRNGTRCLLAQCTAKSRPIIKKPSFVIPRGHSPMFWR